MGGGRSKELEEAAGGSSLRAGLTLAAHEAVAVRSGVGAAPEARLPVDVVAEGSSRA